MRISCVFAPPALEDILDFVSLCVTVLNAVGESTTPKGFRWRTSRPAGAATASGEREIKRFAHLFCRQAPTLARSSRASRPRPSMLFAVVAAAGMLAAAGAYYYRFVYSRRIVISDGLGPSLG